MKFEQGKVYTHQNMSDVLIRVLKVTYEDQDSVKLKIQWFNDRGLNLNVVETIEVKKNELKRWYEWEGKRR